MEYKFIQTLWVRGIDNTVPLEDISDDDANDDDDDPVEDYQMAEQSSSLTRIYELRTRGAVASAIPVTLKGEMKVNLRYSGQG